MEEKDIAYVNRVIHQPALTQTEEFKTWMKDKAHYELYWDTKAAFDLFLLKEGHLPDKNKEWERFKKFTDHSVEPIVQGKRFISKLRNLSHWSAAAMLVLTIGCISYLCLNIFHEPQIVTVVQALSSPQKVTIHNDGGSETLTDRTDTVYHPSSKGRLSRNYFNTIQTPRGKCFKVTLSDGTEVQLNSESSLRYPVCFSGNERLVELRGEAYFKVAKNKKMPFIVKTDYVQTRVLGTEFNVKAYSHAVPHVTLVEGSVAVQSLNGEKKIVLQPGEDASITDATEQLEVQKVDVRSYTAWTTGFLFFENAFLEDIMKELGRWYNVNVEFADPKVMKYQFNFWVNRNCDIQEALELLREIKKVKITYKENTVTIS